MEFTLSIPHGLILDHTCQYEVHFLIYYIHFEIVYKVFVNQKQYLAVLCLQKKHHDSPECRSVATSKQLRLHIYFLWNYI